MASARDVARVAGAGLFWTVIGAGALVFSFWANVVQWDGRQLFGDAFAGWATGQIPGSMTIDRVLVFEPDRVVLEGVVFREPDADTKVLEVGWTEFNPDIPAAFAGDVRLHDVTIRGGSIWIRKAKGPGRLGISRAFSKQPSKQKKQQSSDVALLEPLALADFDAFFDVEGKRFSFRDVDGLVRVRVREEAVMRMDDIEGVFHPPSGPLERIPFHSFSGRVDTGQVQLATAAGSVRIADDDVGVRVAYFDREEPPILEVDLKTEGLSKGTLAALGFAGVSKLLPKIGGSVKLSGGFGKMRLRQRKGKGGPN